MKFSANLGFLWSELSLLDAIRAAKSAGFDAVECHWPFATPAAEVRSALDKTGLQMLGLNTVRGDVAAGENGLSALPDRVDDAVSAIDEAISYASAISCKAVHLMAGFASGANAHDTFVRNLKYACAQAAPHGITILIEPLNRYDAPGYFLTTTTQAVDLIGAVQAPNLKLMFDCYHVQLMEGDLCHKLEDLMPYIGHIQFASVPDRGPPDTGEVNFDHIFKVLSAMGYGKPIGAEYKPNGPTDKTLGWLTKH
ncbi:hydroxypyruvate isomerase family protein [Yoonia sp. R2331]|uniref:hydroxypyruvate isomerase family protein n=1 Tax=Yoonia sp. R2331 TaxID=3237238 RepID=UPI0034E6185C